MFSWPERQGTLLSGCLGGGKTDKEIEVCLDRLTETESALKVPNPNPTLTLQRTPGLGGRSRHS